MPGTAGHGLVVTDDLFFAARLLSVLRTLGFRADSAATQDEAVTKAAEVPDIALVGLASSSAGGLDTVRMLRECGVPRIVCFLSHTRIPEVREAARAAGADLVCANSAITQRLPEIVERVLRGGPVPVEESTE